MIGAAAMSLSSICVVTNALRLNRAKIYSSADDEKRKAHKVTASSYEEGRVLCTLEINGMMCEHCERSVSDALSSLGGLNVISVSHTEGIAVFSAPEKIRMSAVKKAVKQNGYSVISVKTESTDT